MGFDGNQQINLDLIIPSEFRAELWEGCGDLSEMGTAVHAGCCLYISEEFAETLIDCYEKKHEISFIPQKRIDLSKILTNAVMERGMLHPGGMLLIPEWYEAVEFTPLIRSAQGNFVTTEIPWYALDFLYKIDLMVSPGTERVYELSCMSGVNLEDIPLNDPEVYLLFHQDRNTGKEEETLKIGIPAMDSLQTKEIFKKIKPWQFSDIVKIVGMLNGTSVWEGNAEALLENGIAVIKDLITSREDLYEYLLYHGISREDSWRIMDYVRKGRASVNPDSEKWKSMKELMKEHQIPDWYLGSCEKIRYLTLRAHAYRSALEIYWCAWFQVHVPGIFYEIINHEGA